MRYDVPVNGVLRKLWLQNPQQIKRECQHQCGNQKTQIRLQIPQQPACDLPIVGLADGFFFVKLFDGC